jgi:hypothetical protein
MKVKQLNFWNISLNNNIKRIKKCWKKRLFLMKVLFEHILLIKFITYFL